MRATATKTKTVPTPTTMAAAYPHPPDVEGVASNGSKKKKKKKGKGRALDVDQQKVVGAIRGPADGQVDGEDEGIDDDDLPALESTGDHHNHNHHNHYHHHHHTHPDHNHPHINHNYHHHHGHRRTGLSPELESVHLNTTAKLNASAQAALRMTSTASAQAELLAAANELYRRMESETRDPIIDGGGRDGADNNSSEYWAQLPNHIRSFVQTTYAHGAAMSASERQKSEAMLALAQTMVDEAHSRAGFGSAPGVGPPSFDPALLSDPEFQRIVAMSRPPRNMNRFDEYAGEEYYSDNEDLDDLEGVEREQRMLQQYESTNDGTTNGKSASPLCAPVPFPLRRSDPTMTPSLASCADLALSSLPPPRPAPACDLPDRLARPLSDFQEEEKEEEKGRRGSPTPSTIPATHTAYTDPPAAGLHAEPDLTTAPAIHACSTDHHSGAAKRSAAPAQLTGGRQAARIQRQPSVVDRHPHQPSADEQHFHRAIHHKAPAEHDEQIHRTRDQWYLDHLDHLDKREEQALE